MPLLFLCCFFSCLMMIPSPARSFTPANYGTNNHKRSNMMLASSTSADAVKYALFQDQQRALVQMAKKEMELMRANGELADLESFEFYKSDAEKKIMELKKLMKKRKKMQNKAAAGKGFGGGAKTIIPNKPLPPVSKESFQKGLLQAAVLLENGIVRINGALSRASAAALRSAVLEERADAEAAVAAGTTASSKRFGDLNFSQNRRDVLLPLADSKCAPAVVAALKELFGKEGTLRTLYEAIVTENAVMYELASLVSEPGADQQTVHADMPYQKECALYTGFMALQDIEIDMGPTTFLPRTHTQEAHAKLKDQKDEFLQSASARLALLRAGDIAIFDSRGLHSGGYNHVDRGSTRALFYFSFTNPAVGKFESGVNMASIRPGYAAVPLQLGQLCRELVKDVPFEDRGDGLGSEGDELTQKREAFRRQRNAPDGSL